MKSLNYLNNALAKLEARQQGADEALILNARGNDRRGERCERVRVRDGRASRRRRPPTARSPGVTRRRCSSSPASSDSRRRAQPRRVDLLGADEVFLTGTGARIVPVASLDGRRIGSCPGPLTKRLSEAFDARTGRTGTPFL